MKSVVTTETGSNSFYLYMSATETASFEIDCGYGKIPVTIEPGGYNAETMSMSGTSVLCTVADEGVVKIYGDPTLIDYFEANGCYLEQVDLSKCVNLEFLNLEHNKLRALDLTPNTRLQAIYLQDNPYTQETPLTIGTPKPNLAILEIQITDFLSPSFSLTDYPTMLAFDAWGCRTLYSIDTSKCPGLLRLSLDSTPVSSLDVTKNPELIVLNVEDSGITSLDLSKNPKLQQLYMSHYSGTLNTDAKFSKIDVSANPELRYLFAANNELTDINISNNPNLQQLNVSHNRLTSLDISGCPDLYDLSIGFNYMGFADMPAPRETFNNYVYSQNPVPVDRCYTIGSTIDLSKWALREGTTTTATLYTYDIRTDMTTLVSPVNYTFSDGILTLKRAMPDSVYVALSNDLFPLTTLTTTMFKIKNTDEFGKPSKALAFTTGAREGDVLKMRVGMSEATQSKPVEFSVDPGDGNLRTFSAVTSSTPDADNVSFPRSGSGQVVIYAPEGFDLTAFAISDVSISEINTEGAPAIRELTVNNAGLDAIDLSLNNCLRRLDLSGNNLATLDLSGANGRLEKTMLSYIDLSNNILSDFTPNSIQAQRHLDLSHNRFTQYKLRDADNMEYLDLSHNLLTEIDLNYLVAAKTVNIASNDLVSVVMPLTGTFEHFNCSDNELGIGALPVTDCPDYVYAPQRQIRLPEMGPVANLRSQYRVIDGKQTVYEWVKTDGTPVANSDISTEEGFARFINSETGDVYCKISHPAFPSFTGDNILTTSVIKTAPYPTEVAASFSTLEGGRDMTLSLASLDENSTLYVDWVGKGEDMEPMTLSTTYRIFKGKSVADANAKIYSYSKDNRLSVFSLTSGSKLEKVDLSRLTDAISISVSNGYTSNITFPEDRSKITELFLENNNYATFDISKFPNVQFLGIAGNQLSEFDASPATNLQNLGIAHNKIRELKFGDNKKLWALYAASNLISEIDLSGLNSLENLDLSENLLSSIDVSPLTSLRSLALSANMFTFSTLPPVDSSYIIYNYANQAPMPVEVKEDVVDLTSQASVDGSPTVFTWWIDYPYLDEDRQLIGDQLDAGEDYTIKGGVTTFIKKYNNVCGVMTNEAFPNLYLLTEPFNTLGLGIESIAENGIPFSVTVDADCIVCHSDDAESMDVYTISGVLVSKTTFRDGTAVSTPLPSGVYIVKAGDASAKVKI